MLISNLDPFGSIAVGWSVTAIVFLKSGVFLEEIEAALSNVFWGPFYSEFHGLLFEIKGFIVNSVASSDLPCCHGHEPVNFERNVLLKDCCDMCFGLAVHPLDESGGTSDILIRNKHVEHFIMSLKF